MTAIRSLIPSLIVLAASLVLPACYTLLKHPTADTAAYEEIQNNPCTECHYEEELWYYHHAPAHRIYPGPNTDAWGFYYTVPWWYDSYWQYDTPPEASTIPLPSRGLRSGTDKGSAGGSIGGPIAPPPDPKSSGGSVRFKHSDGDSVKDSKDTGEGKANGEETKTRGVRPKTTKEKPKGKEKKGG